MASRVFLLFAVLECILIPIVAELATHTSQNIDAKQLRTTGRSYYSNGKFDEALDMYKKALNLTPQDPSSHAYVATACFKLGDLTCAENGYLSAIKLTQEKHDYKDMDTIPYRSNLGGVYHKSNRFEDAIDVFTAALDIDPNDISLEMNIQATIVDWHKFIMEQEILAAARVEARENGMQYQFESSDSLEIDRAEPSPQESCKQTPSPFWDVTNLLRGRNYTEKAEVIFKEITEQRATIILPAAILLLRSALKDEPNFAIGCHLLADAIVRARDILVSETIAEKEKKDLYNALIAMDPKWKVQRHDVDKLLSTLSDEATAALRGSLNLKYTPSSISQSQGKLSSSTEEMKATPPKLHVVVVATELKYELKLLHATATALGWPLSILGLGKPWRGLGSKVQLLDEFLSDTSGNVKDASKELVLFVDAYDVLLLESAGDTSNGLVERFLKIGDTEGQSWNGASIVFSAEKTCAPDKGLELLYPSTEPEVDKPFTFVNSGSYIGRVDAVRRMLAEVQADIAEHHTINGADPFRLDDQRWFSRFYVRNHAMPVASLSVEGNSQNNKSNGNIPVVSLDRAGAIFHTLHDVPLQAFQMRRNQRYLHEDQKGENSEVASAPVPHSLISSGEPCLIHGNGNGMAVYKRLSEYLSSNGWPPQKATQESIKLLQETHGALIV